MKVVVRVDDAAKVTVASRHLVHLHKDARVDVKRTRIGWDAYRMGRPIRVSKGPSPCVYAAVVITEFAS